MLASLLPLPAVSGGPDPAPAPRPIDGRYAPYSPDPDHPWNRLHQTLFLRHSAGGVRRPAR